MQVDSCDPDDEAAIDSIVTDESRIYLSLSNRDEQEGRKNYVVLNKSDLKVISEEHRPDSIANNDLVAQQHFTTPNYLISASADYAKSSIQITSLSKQGGEPKIVLLENRALQPPTLYSLSERDALLAVVSNEQGNTAKIGLIDITSGTVKTLLDLKTGTNQEVQLISDKNYIFIGNGRDLLIYDIGKLQIRRYLKDYTSVSFDGIPGGVDNNRIVRLMIDQDRLFVFSIYGNIGRVMDLKEIWQ